MLAPTAQYLVRELAKRMGELTLSTPTGGSTTTLIDAVLKQVWPASVTSQLNPWVYGSQTADVANRGIERRGSAWDASSTTLTFYAPWPTAITTGTYEIHSRTSRERKLEALNAGVRELPFAWPSAVLDESLTTAAGTYRYTLPSSILLRQVVRVQLEGDPDATGNPPYLDAGPWDHTLVHTTDSTGNTVSYLQFGSLPPSGRKIRLLASTGYADLVNDTDVLALPEPVAGAATEWLYKQAEFLLWCWELNRQPAGQTERLRLQVEQSLQIARRHLLDLAPPPNNSAIRVPGRGTSSAGAGTDWGWMRGDWSA